MAKRSKKQKKRQTKHAKPKVKQVFGKEGLKLFEIQVGQRTEFGYVNVPVIVLASSFNEAGQKINTGPRFWKKGGLRSEVAAQEEFK